MKSSLTLKPEEKMNFGKENIAKRRNIKILHWYVWILYASENITARSMSSMTKQNKQHFQPQRLVRFNLDF